MRRRAIIGKSKSIINPNPRPEGPGGFKMQIQTTTVDEVFTLPTQSGYTYNATVLWGDGTSSQVTGHNVNNVKTYATAGTYDIEIKGTFDSIYFNNAGSKKLVTKILSWGGSDFQGFTTMNKAFYGCSNLNELAIDSIKEKSDSQITNFSQTFSNCSSLTTLPVDLFRYNTKATNFDYTFYQCTSLTSVPTDLFRYNTLVTNFDSTLYNCKLTSIPSNLFQYNTAVTDFSYTFQNCTSLTSIPIDLFRYNTLVTNFRNTLFGCIALTSIPTDLFRYNTLVTNFNSTLYNCTSLTTLPSNLFQYNTAVTDFSYTFRNCNKLQLRSDIFGVTPDFGTRIMKFNSCFNRTEFTGTQGTAPALWNATMSASSNMTGCFGGAGNSATSLTNYASIPAAWK